MIVVSIQSMDMRIGIFMFDLPAFEDVIGSQRVHLKFLSYLYQNNYP